MLAIGRQKYCLSTSCHPSQRMLAVGTCNPSSDRITHSTPLYPYTIICRSRTRWGRSESNTDHLQEQQKYYLTLLCVQAFPALSVDVYQGFRSPSWGSRDKIQYPGRGSIAQLLANYPTSIKDALILPSKRVLREGHKHIAAAAAIVFSSVLSHE